MLRRLLEIRPGEGRTVLVLGGHFFLILAAASLLQTAAKGLFLETFDARLVPYTYFGGAILGMIATAFYAWLRAEVRPERASIGLAVGLATLLCLLRVAMSPWPQEATFAILLLAPSMGMLLGYENGRIVRSKLDARSSRRLFPAIGALGGLGATAGALLVRGLSNRILPTRELFWIAAAFMVLSLVPRLRVKVKRRLGLKVEPAAWRRIFRHRYSTVLMIMAFLTGLVSIVAQYQLDAAAKDLLPPERIAPFLGGLNSAINAAAIVFILFVSRFLIGRLGIGSSGLVYPVVMAGAGIAGVLVPGLAAAAGAMSAERLVRQNLQRPVAGIAIMPLADSMRIRVGLTISGVLRPASVVLGSIAMLLLVGRISWQSFSWGLLVLSVLILLCGLVARRHYVREVVSALHSRRLRLPDEPDQPVVLDARIRKLLHSQLASEIPEQVVLALELLKGRATTGSVETIERLWPKWDAWVKTAAVACLADEPSSRAIGFMARLGEREPEEVRAAVLRTGLTEPTDEGLEVLADSGPPAIRGEALRLLIERNGLGASAGRLDSWIESPDPKLHACAAFVVGHLDDDETYLRRLPDLARYAPAQALEAMALRPSPDFAELCVRELADDRHYVQARRVLFSLGNQAVPALLEGARDRDRSAQALAILGEIDHPDCRHEVLGLLASDDEELRFRAARALAHGSAEQPQRGTQEDAVLRTAVGREIEICRRIHIARSDSEEILRQEAETNFEWALERVLILISLLQPEEPYRRIYLSLTSGEAGDRSFAIEALDELLEPAWKAILLPMLEGETVPEGSPDHIDMVEDRWRDRVRTALEEPSAEPTLALALRLKSSSLFSSWRLRDLEPVAEVSWHKESGRPIPDSKHPHLVIRDGEPVEPEQTLLTGFTPPIEDGDLLIPLGRLFRTIARRPRCASMWLRGLAQRIVSPQDDEPVDVSRTTLMSLASRTVVRDRDQTEDLDLWRRIFFLRSMRLLTGLSSERLRLVAEIARPLVADRGDVVVREGLTGHHFYLVCTGSAEVTADGRNLATLNPSDGFGAMALLTGRGRSATVRATEPCELLSIGRLDFLDLIDAHPALARAFSRMIAETALGESDTRLSTD